MSHCRLSDGCPTRTCGGGSVHVVRRSLLLHFDLHYTFLATGVVSNERVCAAGGNETLWTGGHIEFLHHLTTRSTKLERWAAPRWFDDLTGLQQDWGRLRKLDPDRGFNSADAHVSMRSCASDCAKEQDGQHRRACSESCLHVGSDVNWPTITPDASEKAHHVLGCEKEEGGNDDAEIATVENKP